MIRVDDRVGSIELLPKLREYGVKVASERLQYGDFAWLGNGPLGRSNIAIERKRIHDLIDSIVSTPATGYGDGIRLRVLVGGRAVATGDEWRA